MVSFQNKFQFLKKMDKSRYVSLYTEIKDINQIIRKESLNSNGQHFHQYIGSVMVSMLDSSVVEPWSGKTKDYKICICCFSAKHIL